MMISVSDRAEDIVGKGVPSKCFFKVNVFFNVKAYKKKKEFHLKF